MYYYRLGQCGTEDEVPLEYGAGMGGGVATRNNGPFIALCGLGCALFYDAWPGTRAVIGCFCKIAGDPVLIGAAANQPGGIVLSVIIVFKSCAAFFVSRKRSVGTSVAFHFVCSPYSSGASLVIMGAGGGGR